MKFYIKCNSNGSVYALEAFPATGQVKPRLFNRVSKDQVWNIVEEYDDIYKIYSSDTNYCLEAYPTSDVVKLRSSENSNADQLWRYEINSNVTKIYCMTGLGGKRYLEAFVTSDEIRPRSKNSSEDQNWILEGLEGTNLCNLI